MAGKPVAEGRCPQTGLTVPECSCKRCLEMMLREFSPGLLGGEIMVTRIRPRRAPPGDRSEAA